MALNYLAAYNIHNGRSAATHLQLFRFLFKTWRKTAFKAWGPQRCQSQKLVKRSQRQTTTCLPKCLPPSSGYKVVENRSPRLGRGPCKRICADLEVQNPSLLSSATLSPESPRATFTAYAHNWRFWTDVEIFDTTLVLHIGFPNTLTGSPSCFDLPMRRAVRSGDRAPCQYGGEAFSLPSHL